jgi:hypothetical protein
MTTSLETGSITGPGASLPYSAVPAGATVGGRAPVAGYSFG